MLSDKILRRVVPGIAAAAAFLAIAAASTPAMAQEPGAVFRNSEQPCRAVHRAWVPAIIGGIIDYLNYVNMKTAASMA